MQLKLWLICFAVLPVMAQVWPPPIAPGNVAAPYGPVVFSNSAVAQTILQSTHHFTTQLIPTVCYDGTTNAVSAVPVVSVSPITFAVTIAPSSAFTGKCWLYGTGPPAAVQGATAPYGPIAFSSASPQTIANTSHGFSSRSIKRMCFDSVTSAETMIPYAVDPVTYAVTLMPAESFNGTCWLEGVGPGVGGAAPTGAASGDLGGNYPNPLVANISAGASLPGTCRVGGVYFLSTAPAGQNIYECASTNTWTQQLNSGGGGGPATAITAGASLPGTCTVGAVYFLSTATAGQNIYECQSTNVWTQQINSGGGANALGTYLVKTATNAPANSQVMGALATGIVKNTTATGAQSIAVAGDFPTLNQTTTGNALTSTTASGISVGASLPGTCAVGALYFLSTAPAGQNIYECAVTNTWSQQSATLPSAPTFTGLVSAAGFSTTATTPGKQEFVAGVGNIPALTANSAGFAAPAAGGTSYLIKMPATITAGVPVLSAPATAEGVNESGLAVVAGTVGQVFTSNGPSLPPSFQASAGGGTNLATTPPFTGANTGLFFPFGLPGYVQDTVNPAGGAVHGGLLVQFDLPVAREFRYVITQITGSGSAGTGLIAGIWSLDKTSLIAGTAAVQGLNTGTVEKMAFNGGSAVSAGVATIPAGAYWFGVSSDDAAALMRTYASALGAILATGGMTKYYYTTGAVSTGAGTSVAAVSNISGLTFNLYSSAGPPLFGLVN